MTDNDSADTGEIHALLGRGTSYEGKLAFSGRVRIDGHFTGEARSDGILILGDGAEVNATIDVGVLIVRGATLRGTVRATQLVELHSAARVHADIHSPQLFVDKGALFDGRCTMDGASVAPLDAL